MNKYSSQTKYNTPVSKGLPPIANSALKTKPVAVSSFIIPPEEKQEAEDIMPDKQDWDASVIEPLKKLDIIANKKTTKPGKKNIPINTKMGGYPDFNRKRQTLDKVISVFVG